MTLGYMNGSFPELIEENRNQNNEKEKKKEQFKH
jgi:hypothetical protein